VVIIGSTRVPIGNPITVVEIDPNDFIIGIMGLSNLSRDEIDWLDDPANENTVAEILNFLEANRNPDNSFSQELIDLVEQAISNLISFNVNNYPGKNDGFPFEWWLDSNFIMNSGNFDMPSDVPNNPNESPNAVEASLFAIFPKEAVLHIQNSISALDTAQDLAENNTFNEGSPMKSLNNGKSDAFRHAFWNALDTAEFGASITKLFTDAHEFGETGIDSRMDLFNNGQGRDIAVNNNYGFFTSDITISLVIQQAVFDGILKYLSPTENNGGIIDGITQIIFTNQ